MWALLDTDNKTVLACIPPSVTFDKMLLIANGRTVIPMSIENSPAYVGGTYIDGKFYEKEGN